MLSTTELFFIRLLRGTIIFTAGLALLAACAAMSVAAYGRFAPEPVLKLSEKIDRLRKATDPKTLLSPIFPENASLFQNSTGRK